MQIFALGLLGELIIFTHARGLKDYRVEEVIQYPDTVAASDDGSESACRSRQEHGHAAGRAASGHCVTDAAAPAATCAVAWRRRSATTSFTLLAGSARGSRSGSELA